MNEIDPYRTLGVERGCTHEEVREAFRARVMAVHPDRGGEELRFVQLRAAYEEIVGHLDRRALVRASANRGPAAPGAGRTGPSDTRRARRGAAEDIQYLGDVHDRGPSGHAVGIRFLPDRPDPGATREQYLAWFDRVSTVAQRRKPPRWWRSAQFLAVGLLLWAFACIPMTAIWSMVYTIPEIVRISERSGQQAEVLWQFVVLSYAAALPACVWAAWKYRDG